MQTITRRGTHISKEPVVFAKEFATNRDKVTQWRAFQRRTAVGADVDFQKIIEVICIFLKPVFDCIVEGEEFFGYWNKDTFEWLEP